MEPETAAEIESTRLLLLLLRGHTWDSRRSSSAAEIERAGCNSLLLLLLAPAQGRSWRRCSSRRSKSGSSRSGNAAPARATRLLAAETEKLICRCRCLGRGLLSLQRSCERCIPSLRFAAAGVGAIECLAIVQLAVLLVVAPGKVSLHHLHGVWHDMLMNKRRQNVMGIGGVECMARQLAASSVAVGTAGSEAMVDVRS